MDVNPSPNEPVSRIERWAFALLMLLAVGAMFAFGFESIARHRLERGLILLAIGVVSIITMLWLLLNGSQDV